MAIMPTYEGNIWKINKEINMVFLNRNRNREKAYAAVALINIVNNEVPVAMIKVFLNQRI